MKNNLIFIYSTNILVRLLTVNMKNFLTPKNPKMCDPTLVTVWKMQRHYSQSSRENATPSSGTSPFASYKEVTPPLLRVLYILFIPDCCQTQCFLWLFAIYKMFLENPVGK